MLIRRFWVDGDGDPHVEEVTLIAGVPAVHPPGGPVEIEGSVPAGPSRAVAVVDPVCGVDALGEGLAGVWTAEPLADARIVDRSEWESIVADQAAARAAQLAAMVRS